MNLNEMQDILTEFSEKYNLKQKAFDACRLSMSNCIKDSKDGLGGYKIEEIKLVCIKRELVFEDYLFPSPIVKTIIGLYKSEENDTSVGNHEHIGSYDHDTDLNGEYIDDWLVIDQHKNNHLNILDDLRQLDEILPQNYFRRNSIYYEYVSYIAHIATSYHALNFSVCQVFMSRAFVFIETTEIQEDFRLYTEKSKRFIKRIACYLEECGLLEERFIEDFKELKILKHGKKSKGK